ncbi:hypothetical protein KAR91_13045 [Candidatus Pacearchaeota archaeon]|nr:hypothetical protein [Candidatus Pacearchaeota archaeon]
MQPQGLQNSLDEVLDAVDGSYDFWFPFEQNIIIPKPDDVFFIQNIGYFAVNSVDNWGITGGDYTHVSATYRESNIITDAGGTVDFSLKQPLLPVYNNPYPTGGMLDRVLSAHQECFEILYSDRSFYVSDQDIRRFPRYSVLRFVDQDQIMHPLLNNSDGPTSDLLTQQGESNYNAKVMLSFWGGQAINDRNTWETMVFHELLMEVWDKYEIGITDDWYPENLTDTDQNRRLQKARTSYTVNVINTQSLDFTKTTSVAIEQIDVEDKEPSGSGV